MDHLAAGRQVIVAAIAHAVYDPHTGLMLIQQIRIARTAIGLTRAELADRIGVDAQAIKRLEAGSGSVSMLVSAMTAIDLHLASVGRGKTLPEQLKANRLRRATPYQTSPLAPI